MKTIKIDVSPAGNVEVDLIGFKGKGCKKITDQIQLALGGDSESKPKPEYSLPESILNTTKNRI